MCTIASRSLAVLCILCGLSLCDLLSLHLSTVISCALYFESPSLFCTVWSLACMPSGVAYAHLPLPPSLYNYKSP